MGLKGIRKEDLSSGNLDRLIDELRKAISDGEYKTVQDFAREFAGVVANLEVKVTAEGKRELVIGSDRVNFDEVVAKIREPIEKAKNPDTPVIMDDAKRDEYYKMFAEVDSTLSGLFKQHEMMDVLLERKLSPDLFAQRIDEANAESQAKIDKYKDELKNLKKLESELMGKNDRSTGKKNFKTEVGEYEKAKGFLENIPTQLEEIKNLKDQIDKMNADVADPSKGVTKEMVEGHITAAEARIAELKTSIKRGVDAVKGFSIPGVDLSDVEAAIADTPTKSFDDAKTTAEKFLNGDGTIPSMDGRVQKRYEELAAAIIAKDTGLDAATKTKLTAPVDPKDVDEYLAGLRKKIETVEKAKKTEEILVVAREASAQTYKEKSERYRDIRTKIDYAVETDADGNPVHVMEQAKDPSGNLLFIGEDGRPTTQELRADGTTHNDPMMIPVMKVIDEAAFLADFDEGAKKTEIENSRDIKNMTTEAIEKLSFSERRDVLKRIGRGGPVSRFFRALFRLNSSDPAIRGVVKTAEIEGKKTQLLEAAKKGHIEAKKKPLVEEFFRETPNIKAMQEVYEAEKRSAAVQERMQDGAFEIAERHEDVGTDHELIVALDEAAMESAAVAYAFEVLGDAKLQELLKKKGVKVKAADIQEASKQETLSSIVDKTTSNLSNPVIDDRKTPTHTDER